MDSFTIPELIDILFVRGRYPVCVHRITGERIPFWDLKKNQWNLIVSIPAIDKKKIEDMVLISSNYKLNEYEYLCLLDTGWLLFKDNNYIGERFDEWKFNIKE